VDDGLSFTPWYRDLDQDSYGSSSTTVACSKPDGYVAQAGDCDDNSASIYPGATETCNAIDDDCDGQVDEGATLTWYQDNDKDGWGGNTVTTQSCQKPAGYVAQAGDCDDSKATVNPGATEVCDYLDNDCNGQIDDVEDAPTWYRDGDQDGYGDPYVTVENCWLVGGYTDKAGDCDDEDPEVNQSAKEIWIQDGSIFDYCADEVDNDCNGQIDESDFDCQDMDSDGIENGIDAINVIDHDGDGKFETISIMAEMVMDYPYNTGAVYPQGEPLTSGGYSNVDQSKLIPFSSGYWNFSFTGLTDQVGTFRFISNQATQCPWVVTNLNLFCQTTEDPFCKVLYTTDGCSQPIDFVVGYIWEEGNLTPLD